MSTASELSHGRQILALERAFGPQILALLQDPKIVEVMLNPDGKLWIDELGGSMSCVLQVDPIRARTILDTVAAILETVITPDSPILECELPLDGSRFEGLIPPLVVNPVFTIRKKALQVFTLADYVAKGIMSQAQLEVIEAAISLRQNILVIGGTGSGKTTLVNAVLEAVARIWAENRIIVIEDTRELQVKSENVVFLRTADNTDMTRLLRATMRLRPDHIVVGEVRDGSALALLKAWNTGHPGGAGTVHANHALAALIRIEQLIEEVSTKPQQKLIAEAVNVVVSIARTPTGRIVKEVLRVKGWSEAGGYDVEQLA
ncbi:MAG: hypothetical protein RLY95_1608 [Pseudomonadota bacterium]|jgi:type IV secretion system protein TrbB